MVKFTKMHFGLDLPKIWKFLENSLRRPQVFFELLTCYSSFGLAFSYLPSPIRFIMLNLELTPSSQTHTNFFHNIFEINIYVIVCVCFYQYLLPSFNSALHEDKSYTSIFIRLYVPHLSSGLTHSTLSMRVCFAHLCIQRKIWYYKELGIAEWFLNRNCK